MGLVCVDTQILIWAIKEEATPGQDGMIPRSKALLKYLSESDKKILIPAVVLGEFLIKMPTESHRTVFNLMQREFVVAQYDAKAALHYARIWRARQGDQVFESLKESGKTRQELKADRMIVATAVAHEVECIYSHDRGVMAFGKDFVDVQCVPEIPVQIGMFDPVENDRQRDISL